MSAKAKLVVVGDGVSGKTALLIAFLKDYFFQEWIPTVSENYAAEIEINNQTVELTLLDTSGHEDYKRLRSLLYAETDIFLICFSVVDSESLDNVLTQWYPEIRHVCPNIPVFLIGTKQDLKDDKLMLDKLEKIKMKPVSKAKTEAVAKQIGALKYIECSAKTKHNVHEVFVEAALAALLRKSKIEKTHCTIF